MAINIQEVYRTPKKKILPSHNNQNNKCTEQRKILKAVREKGQATLQQRPKKTEEPRQRPCRP